MKKISLILSISMLSSVLLTPTIKAEPLSAEQLMDKVNNRYVGDNGYSRLEFSYQTDSGSKKEMVFNLWNQETADGNRTLIKYVEPSFMRDSGVLIHGFEQQSNLQWLYLSRASNKVPRKVPDSDKGNSLFGTDFYYIDIENKKSADFKYVDLGVDTINEKLLRKIQATPINPEYPYQKTISWVDENLAMEIKIEFFQDDNLLKILQVDQIDVIEDIPTATQVTVTNFKRQSKTLMRLANVDYNIKVDDDQFSFKALTAKSIK